MGNNTILKEGILSAIDNIDDIMMESEMDVLSSMIDSYDKAMTIMENYDGDDMESFSIFQEADSSAVQSGDPSTANSANAKKNDSIFLKILMLIPNLIKQLIAAIKKAWNGNIVPATETATEKVKQVPKSIRGKFNKLRGIEEKNWYQKWADNKLCQFLGINPRQLAGQSVGLLASIAAFYVVFQTKIPTIIANWWKKVKSFFKKSNNDNTSTDKNEGTSGSNENTENPDGFKFNINWDELTIETNLNLEELPKIFGEGTSDIFDSIAKMSTTGQKIDSINTSCFNITQKIEKIRDVNPKTDSAKTYTCDQIVELFKKANINVEKTTENGNKAIENVEKLIKTLTPTDGINADNNSKRDTVAALSKLLSALKDTVGVAINTTSMVGDLSKLYNEGLNKFAEATKNVDENPQSADNGSEGESNNENPEQNGQDGSSEKPTDAAESGKTNNGDTSADSDEKTNKKKQANREYQKAARGKSTKQKIQIREQIANKYGLTVDEVIHESVMFDIDDMDDVVHESVSSGWYNR